MMLTQVSGPFLKADLQWVVRVCESAATDKPNLTTLGTVFLADMSFLAGTLLYVADDLPEELRLRPDVAVRTAGGGHFRRQKRVGLRRGDELHELNHGSAVGLGPLGPGVGGEGLAGDEEEAVQVEIESLVDGLVPVGEGSVLEAFLDGDGRLGVGDLGVGVRGRALVRGLFDAVRVGGAGAARGFGAAHDWD